MLDPNAVGRTAESESFSWTRRDVMLYALGVGASAGDQFADLQFTTDNSEGIVLQALPTFGAVLTQQAGVRPSVGDLPLGIVVHASQSVRLHRPIPVEGTARAKVTVVGIYDKGSGGVAEYETELFDVASGELLVTARSSSFGVGAGGFGGERGPKWEWNATGAPTHTISYPTYREQALLYRLSGDYNPLHSDPSVAKSRGMDVPILHGMCTYGFTGRALLAALCDNDPARFVEMSGRFTKPMIPGDTLTVEMWTGETGPDGTSVQYRTTSRDGVAVLEGFCTVRP